MENNNDVKILSKDYIIENGINFEESLEYGGPYGQGIVQYDEENNEILFTGIAYELFSNGNIESYMYVLEGVKQGQIVDFYPDGKVKRIGYMDRSAAEGEQIEYFENNKIKSIINAVAGRRMTYKIFDREGNIIEEKKEPTESDIVYAKKFG